MIIDVHTHIFPPAIRDDREAYCRREPTFAEMYAHPEATIATSEELLRSMDEAGVDISVALGFAWNDYELCVRHNDYLLESAAKSRGRILAFCTVNMAAGELAAKEIARCARTRGLGELRPDSQGWDLAGEAGEALASSAAKHGLLLLFHVSEPVGREYPGKRGGEIAGFYRFAAAHPELQILGAHLAGGLPFYGSMPEVRDVFSHTYVDTAAERLLYTHTAYAHVRGAIGADRVLFGSDFPLVSQKRELMELGAAIGDSGELALVLGGNAARLLGIEA